MQILTEKISREQLKELAANTFVDMIKCVADVNRGLLAVDAELHADLESMLLEQGSEQEFLWGFNLYPDETGDDFIEFDSLINIRAWQGNRSRDVEDESVRKQIKELVSKFVE
jgi:Ca2+-binding EF-hand superfamily protein